ncbi:MAG TPA: GDSL-type esterase/lipase family protein [Acidobacteriaceae bacterium]|jgi:lysophospholipase L1-like esterase
MCSRFSRLSRSVVLTVICALASFAVAQSAPPSIHKSPTPPALTPLTLAIGGRLQTKPTDTRTFGGKNYIYQWPGTYFRAAFAGSSVYLRILQGDQILHIVVDDSPAALLTKPVPGVYEIEGLANTHHTITVFVATESQAAPNTFGGLAIPKNETALPAPPRDRQIEFIGDSHTVGYGNLSPTHACTDAQVWSDTDNTQAFGPLTARHYIADYQINAISGRGVVRNYNGGKADTLPQAYPYVLFDKKQIYADASWHPQVIVVALGTNDFSTPLNAGERWKTKADLHADVEVTYLHFLQQLRAKNPAALLIVWATDMEQGEIESEAKKVVDEMKQHGDQHIAFLPIDHLGFTACNSHPSLADEQTISRKLIDVIESNQVWQTP